MTVLNVNEVVPQCVDSNYSSFATIGCLPILGVPRCQRRRYRYRPARSYLVYHTRSTGRAITPKGEIIWKT